MSEPEIIVLDDPEALYVHAAEEIAHFAGETVCTRGEFNLCLSGGSTPASVYDLLGTRFRLSIDWKEVQFFWGDERCVPPTDAASNFGMAQRTLLSKLSLRDSQIHRMRGEDDPNKAALEYESELRRVFGLDPQALPRFDVMLLGLGDNSHTASLFPGDPAIHEHERLAVAVEVDAKPSARITLTPAVINNSARTIFLACGAAKSEAVWNVLRGPRDADRFPAQIVDPPEGQVVWMLDKTAAARIS